MLRGVASPLMLPAALIKESDPLVFASENPDQGI
jgi:hypothetical protein